MTTKLTKKEANKQLAELVEEVYTALRKAECFAREHELSFRISPTRGMGGTYCLADRYNAYDFEAEEGEYFWLPSSYNC